MTSPKEQVLQEIECSEIRLDLDLTLLRQELLKQDDKQQIDAFDKQITQLEEAKEILSRKKKLLQKMK